MYPELPPISAAGINSTPGRFDAWLLLSLPLRLEHRGVERLACGLAGPDHELEGREVALAGIERGAEQRLALPARGFDAAGQHQRVAVHDQAVLDPEI